MGQEVDLTFSLQIVSPLCSPVRPTFRRVLTQDGVPLPFAWVTLNELALQCQPFSGKCWMTDLSLDPSVLTASAPGYYSKSQIITSHKWR